MTDHRRKVGRDRNGKSIIPSLRVPWEHGQIVQVITTDDAVTLTKAQAELPHGMTALELEEAYQLWRSRKGEIL